MRRTSGTQALGAGRIVLVVVIALLVGAMPSPAAAANVWGEPVLVAGPQARSGANSLLTFGATGSIVAYTENYRVPDRRSYLRRTEAGITTIIPLGSGNGVTKDPSLAGRGNDMDVVWIREGGRGPYVKYRRSTDAGVTWSETLNLTPVGASIRDPEVDRDGRGRVAAIWENWEHGRIRIRVSTDGGATFRKAVTVAKGSSPSVALGGGVITVAYREPCCPELPDGFEGEFGHPLIVRRSTDDGRTWSAPIPLADWAGSPDAYAVGKTVVVAYGKVQPNAHEWVAVRRSLDGGKTWGPGVSLSSKRGKTDHFPVVWGRGGLWHAAFEKCLANFGPELACEEAELYYRSSLDHGLTWSPREMLPAAPVTSRPIGVGATSTGPVVAWNEFRDASTRLQGCFCRLTVHMATATGP